MNTKIGKPSANGRRTAFDKPARRTSGKRDMSRSASPCAGASNGAQAKRTPRLPAYVRHS